MCRYQQSLRVVPEKQYTLTLVRIFSIQKYYFRVIFPPEIEGSFMAERAAEMASEVSKQILRVATSKLAEKGVDVGGATDKQVA